MGLLEGDHVTREPTFVLLLIRISISAGVLTPMGILLEGEHVTREPAFVLLLIRMGFLLEGEHVAVLLQRRARAVEVQRRHVCISISISMH